VKATKRTIKKEAKIPNQSRLGEWPDNVNKISGIII